MGFEHDIYALVITLMLVKKKETILVQSQLTHHISFISRFPSNSPIPSFLDKNAIDRFPWSGIYSNHGAALAQQKTYGVEWRHCSRNFDEMILWSGIV